MTAMVELFTAVPVAPKPKDPIAFASTNLIKRMEVFRTAEPCNLCGHPTTSCKGHTDD